MNFTVYDKTTGFILRTGTAPKEMVHIQTENNDEAVIYGTADDVCDQVNPIYKVVMKNYRISKKESLEQEETKRKEQDKMAEKKALIKNKLEEIAMRELIKESKLA